MPSRVIRADLCSVVTRTGPEGMAWGCVCQGRFGLDIWTRFSTHRVAGYWHGIPRKAVTVQSLTEFRKSSEPALGHTVWLLGVSCALILCWTQWSLWILPAQNILRICVVCAMSTYPWVGRAALLHLERAVMVSSPEGKADCLRVLICCHPALGQCHISTCKMGHNVYNWFYNELCEITFVIQATLLSCSVSGLAMWGCVAQRGKFWPNN